MTCNCRKEVTEKLLERFKEKSPEATGHTVSLEGYAMILGESVVLKGCMPIAAKALYPLRKGGTKEKKTTQNMIFTFCPFCGVKYEEAA